MRIFKYLQCFVLNSPSNTDQDKNNFIKYFKLKKNSGLYKYQDLSLALNYLFNSQFPKMLNKLV